MCLMKLSTRPGRRNLLILRLIAVNLLLGLTSQTIRNMLWTRNRHKRLRTRSLERRWVAFRPPAHGGAEPPAFRLTLPPLNVIRAFESRRRCSMPGAVATAAATDEGGADAVAGGQDASAAPTAAATTAAAAAAAAGGG